MTINRRSVLASLAVAPFGALLTQAQSPGAPRQFKAISSRDRIAQKYFPNVVLTTHEGKKVRFYDDLVKNKIVIFNFMYARCEGVCMPITKNLVKVQRLLGDRVGRDIHMYSLTLKPEEDTPKKLAHYIHMHKIGPGWKFLTGKPEDLELLRRKLGYVDPDPEVDKVKSNHIGMIKYGNEPFERWGGCPAMSKPASMARL